MVCVLNKSCQNKFMTIKTDMSKAYDRIEWNFIEALLHKMGFDPYWIKLMRGCISSVQYRILLNGQPRGLITPQRGLLQGDPLSFYLFIMCTEALISINWYKGSQSMSNNFSSAFCR